MFVRGVSCVEGSDLCLSGVSRCRECIARESHEPSTASRPSRSTLDSLAATGVGAAKALVAQRPELVGWAHAAGLTVTPYTFRSADTGAFTDVTAEMDHFLYTLGVDALFTNHPDRFPRR